MTKVFSFPAVEDQDARVLILGSMPGKASLEANEYYAHPRNAFWPILREFLGFDSDADYAHRLTVLKQHGIALWDVMHCCVREGSLDSDIEDDSIEPNDFETLFATHSGIEGIYFNGAKAELAFERHVVPTLSARFRDIARTRLPSTSPAHAAMSFSQKLEAWRVVLD